MAAPQTYANHARYVPLYHFVTFGLLTLNLVYRVQQLRNAPSAAGLVDVGLGTALVLLAWYARAFALAVQDRVIRLEMTLRLQRVAPEAHAQAARFTPAQLAALRFAGDGELPGLARQVLDGTLAKPADIKRAVRDWQADHLRV